MKFGVIEKWVHGPWLQQSLDWRSPYSNNGDLWVGDTEEEQEYMDFPIRGKAVHDVQDSRIAAGEKRQDKSRQVLGSRSGYKYQDLSACCCSMESADIPQAATAQDKVQHSPRPLLCILRSLSQA